MSDFIKRRNLAENSDFKTKVRMAALYTAQFALANESRQDEWLYFSHILRAPLDEGWIVPLAYLTSHNATLFSATTEEGVNSSPDNDIQYTVDIEIVKLSK